MPVDRHSAVATLAGLELVDGVRKAVGIDARRRMALNSAHSVLRLVRRAQNTLLDVRADARAVEVAILLAHDALAGVTGHSVEKLASFALLDALDDVRAGRCAAPEALRRFRLLWPVYGERLEDAAFALAAAAHRQTNTAACLKAAGLPTRSRGSAEREWRAWRREKAFRAQLRPRKRGTGDAE
ncbi:hypothetical protein ACOQFB_01005 [Anaeromyxobacter sp. Red801]|uniref:hypothetical protein n=1 Tax=Anaeromyxobacter sp. Red801 TaxID=3411632 RepID=UPI003B9F00F7